MHEHGGSRVQLKEGQRQIILVGNPNVGKSLIFAYLSGRYVAVSNYPGTTVEVTHGQSRHDGALIIDTPGTNGLVPQSEDERIARDILLEAGDKVVVQVGDAKNLRRALSLSLQLAELGLPFVLAMNMVDEAQGRGIGLDAERLSQILGVPVVETVAVTGRGMSSLRDRLPQAARSSFRVSYSPEIQAAAQEIAAFLPKLPVDPLAVALMLLCGDSALHHWLALRSPQAPQDEGHGAHSGHLNGIEEVVVRTQSRFTEPLGYAISQQRAAAVEAIVQQVSRQGPRRARTWADRFGQWSMHPVAGIPILLGILYLIYKLVGEFGAGVVVDFVQKTIFGGYINPWARALFGFVPIPLVQELFVGQFGLITMGLTYALAIVLPILTFFFLAFGVLEDSGYLPRLAIMANRGFKAIGLSGKAVLPMVLGLGCDTMATMTTRILETKRDRIIATLLLALGIPCSAQLGVILAMLAGVAPGTVGLFVAVIASQLLLVGFLAARIIPGETSDFVVEVPPIRLPQLSNVLLKTLYRVEWFFKEAVPLFMVGTLVLFAVDKVGLLALLTEVTKPVVQGWLGLPPEATVSFILGFLRRDYGAAGFFALAAAGQLDTIQVLVSLTTLTLFVPCIANFFVIIKEHGLGTALAMVAFIFPFAVLVGGVLNLALRNLGVSL